MAGIHQVQRLVRHETDIHPADTAYRAIFLLLRALAAQRDVERAQSVDLHFIALRERQTQLLYKSLDSVLHISRCERRIRLDRIRQLIDVHNSHSTRFLAYIIQHLRIFLIHILSALIALH